MAGNKGWGSSTEGGRGCLVGIVIGLIVVAAVLANYDLLDDLG